jgi:hypothetical protein
MRPRAAALIVFFTLLGCCIFVASGLGSAQETNKHFEKADIVLECYRWDKFYIPDGDVDEECKHWPGVSPERIKEALKNTKPKNRIDIWLGKGLWNSPSEADKVRTCETYAMSLGYQETIIFGAKAFPPIPVIFDSGMGGHQIQAKPMAPIIYLPKQTKGVETIPAK